MSQQELLSTIAWALDAAGIAYLVTGDLAACLHGALRPPRGLELLVDVTADSTVDFCAAFPPPAFYLSEIDIGAAVVQRRPFNVLSLVDCTRIDCALPTGGAFDASRLARRIPIALGGVEVAFPTAEDALLDLLSRGPAAAEAAAELYAIQRTTLDRDYLGRWAHELGLADCSRWLLEEPRRR